MKRLLLGLVLLGCEAGPEGPPLTHRFAARPIRLMASPELPMDCQAAAEHTVAWYRARSVSITYELAEGWEPPVNGIVQGGVVAVVPGILDPGVRGETRIAKTVGDDIFAAESTLAACDDLTVTHEVGHALGLVHFGERGNLMFPEIEGCGWQLTLAQQQWIADYDVFGSSTDSVSTAVTWDRATNVDVITCK